MRTPDRILVMKPPRPQPQSHICPPSAKNLGVSYCSRSYLFFLRKPVVTWFTTPRIISNTTEFASICHRSQFGGDRYQTKPNEIIGFGLSPRGFSPKY